MLDTEAAWAAGFFDGEGHVGIRYAKHAGNRNAWFRLVVTVSNTCLASLERLKTSFGFGTIHAHKLVEGRRQGYEWMLSSLAAEKFIRTVKPYSLVKLPQIEIALEFRSLGQRKPYQKMGHDEYERMAAMAEKIRSLNGRNYQKDRVRVPHKYYIEVG